MPTAKINNWAKWPFVIILFLTLLTPFWVFGPLLFPFITSKAFYFRIMAELALPFYVYLVWAHPHLRPSKNNRLTWAILAFLVLNLLTAFTGVNITRSLWGNFERMGGVYYLLHLTLIYFYVLLLAKLSENYLKKFLQCLIGVSVLLSINAVFGKIGWMTLTLDPSLPTRASSTFGNPIFFASFLILPLAISSYFALSARGPWRKSMYWLWSVLILLGVYLSGTRGAVVGLVLAVIVGIILFLFTGGKNKAAFKARTWAALGLMLVVLAVGIGFFSADKFPQGSIIKRIFQLNDSNSKARLIQWNTAWQGFKEKPLFGFGPENYYVVGAKYSNPAINEYDPAWFDKPHNYYLEVLDSTGILGFFSYITMLSLVLYGLWQAKNRGFLSPAEFLVLLGGFLAYLFQNLFVFDTVSPSIIFFIFIGLAGYFFEADSRAENAKPTSAGHSFAGPAFGLSGLAVTVLVYYTNILPVAAAVDTNMGYVYGVRAPSASSGYFKRALNNSLNFDKSAAAIRYSEFAEDLLKENAETDPQLVLEQLRESLKYQKSLTEKVGNDTLMWIRLAGDEVILALAEGRQLGEESENPVRKAISLAPNRVEPWQALLQLESYRKNWPGAVAAAEKMVQINPYNPRYEAMLAQALHESGRNEAAAKRLEEAVARGYQMQTPQEFLWLIDYYRNNNNYRELAKLYETYLSLRPSDFDAFLSLAEIYIKLGDKQHAQLILQNLLLQNPQEKSRIKPLLEQTNL